MGNTPSNGNDEGKNITTPNELMSVDTPHSVVEPIVEPIVEPVQGQVSAKTLNIPNNLKGGEVFIEEIGNHIISKLHNDGLDFTLLKANKDTGLRKKIKLLLIKDKEITELVGHMQVIIGNEDNIDSLFDDLVSIYLVQLDFEGKKAFNLSKGKLVEQFQTNKDELLEKFKKSSNINVGGDRSSNNIASLTKEELTEIFSLAENATGFDISSYDLDLLSEEQLTAIFGNFKNIKIADLSGTNFTLGKAKGEIIFSNLEKCETLIFGENNVTDDVLELMVKYLKIIESIDFTMCELNQKQKDFIEKALPNTKFDFGDDM